MARLVAVANQKGGVAKTTTVHALGYALAAIGRRVLMVDLDPQADLTFSTGIDSTSLKCSMYDVMGGHVDAADACVALEGPEGLDVLPATFDLFVTEVDLAPRTGREYALARALAPVHGSYDVVLVDCPPSLGLLTVNALTAAEEVVIPCQCETLSDRGVGQLLELIADVRMFTNPGLDVRGVIPTMFDRHTTHNRSILVDIEDRHGVPVLHPPVRKSIRFAEASRSGKSILEYAPDLPAAGAYRQLAQLLDTSAPQRSRVLAVGCPVAVRDRYQGNWAQGFDIAGRRGAEYVVRRLSDDSVLPGTFGAEDVRAVTAGKAAAQW
ncbi:MAG TPA: ParA family protein [Acidimicrobiales bacterium]|nr:ParA family protein [Acidimicrobiales bacterium]